MSKVTKLNAVTLSKPIKIDGKDVSEITLRKPNTGELRGLKLVDVLQMDVNSHLELLPRITQPHLSTQQIAALDPTDFTDLVSKTLLFFVKPKQLEGQVLEMRPE